MVSENGPRSTFPRNEDSEVSRCHLLAEKDVSASMEQNPPSKQPRGSLRLLRPPPRFDLGASWENGKRKDPRKCAAASLSAHFAGPRPPAVRPGVWGGGPVHRRGGALSSAGGVGRVGAGLPGPALWVKHPGEAPPPSAASMGDPQPSGLGFGAFTAAAQVASLTAAQALVCSLRREAGHGGGRLGVFSFPTHRGRLKAGISEGPQPLVRVFLCWFPFYPAPVMLQLQLNL